MSTSPTGPEATRSFPSPPAAAGASTNPTPSSQLVLTRLLADLPPPDLDRLTGGLLLATSPRVAWATLVRRAYGCDVLACNCCGGRLRVLAAITEPATARKIP